MEAVLCIALEALVQVRAAPSHRAELVTQLLFGEHFTIEEETEGWLRIITQRDSYPGWVAANQVLQRPDPLACQSLLELPLWVVAQPYALCDVGAASTHVHWMGSLHYGTEEAGYVNFELAGVEYTAEAKRLVPYAPQPIDSLDHIRILLHSPYLWGGRSPAGIDCSGFTQLAYRLLGHALPRDASQQAIIGETIPFGEQRVGDLAFFNNPAGDITHVGLVTEDAELVLHASGHVREDLLTPAGIVRQADGVLTHTLHSLRRTVQ
jgi:gamma-D-glutamyl-L-lysine dipeptidyl-peptidase